MKIKISQIVCISILIATICVPALAQKSKAPQTHGANADGVRPPDHHVEPNAPVWKQYQIRGEQASYKGNKELAKEYYLKALGQIDRLPKQGSTSHSNFVRLENDILKLYPNYPGDKPPGEGEAQLKLDEEELAMLNKLHRLNQSHGTANSITDQLVLGQITYVKQDLEKNSASKTSQESGSEGQKSE